MGAMRGAKSSNLISVAIYERGLESDSEVEATSVLRAECNSNEEKEAANVMKRVEFDGFKINKKRQSWGYGDLYNIIRDGIDEVLVDIRAGGTVSGVEFSKRITNRNPLADALHTTVEALGLKSTISLASMRLYAHIMMKAVRVLPHVQSTTIWKSVTMAYFCGGY